MMEDRQLFSLDVLVVYTVGPYRSLDGIIYLIKRQKTTRSTAGCCSVQRRAALNTEKSGTCFGLPVTFVFTSRKQKSPAHPQCMRTTNTLR